MKHATERTPQPAQHQLELETARARTRNPGREARRAQHHPARETSLQMARLRSAEAELQTLRRELGPQRPRLPDPPPAGSGQPEPWMPAAIERHLTALHDHDVAPLDTILAADVVFTEAAFPQASRRGKAEVTALHAELFATWTDFRFMPRYWHNAGGAAFLEGDASFVHCGTRHGIRADGAAVRIDLLVIYYLAGERIQRIKLYYDAASISHQISTRVTL